MNDSFDPIGSKTLEAISHANHFNKWMYETIKPFLKGEILEIGSGIGNISRFAIEDGFSITLSDINPEYNAILWSMSENSPSVRGVLSLDLQHPHFMDHYSEQKEKYDTIFLLNVIEHLKDDKAAATYCAFLLKQGGNLVILAPAYQWLFCRLDRDLGHFRRYTTKSLTSILNPAEFKIIQKRYFNLAGIGGWFLSGKILGNRSLKKGEMTAFNKLVPLARLLDNLFLHKIGLSAIVTAVKK